VFWVHLGIANGAPLFPGVMAPTVPLLSALAARPSVSTSIASIAPQSSSAAPQHFSAIPSRVSSSFSAIPATSQSPFPASPFTQAPQRPLSATASTWGTASSPSIINSFAESPTTTTTTTTPAVPVTLATAPIYPSAHKSHYYIVLIIFCYKVTRYHCFLCFSRLVQHSF
jgi:hypothetical protein